MGIFDEIFWWPLDPESVATAKLTKNPNLNELLQDIQEYLTISLWWPVRRNFRRSDIPNSCFYSNAEQMAYSYSNEMSRVDLNKTLDQNEMSKGDPIEMSRGDLIEMSRGDPIEMSRSDLFKKSRGNPIKMSRDDLNKMSYNNPTGMSCGESRGMSYSNAEKMSSCDSNEMSKVLSK